MDEDYLNSLDDITRGEWAFKESQRDADEHPLALAKRILEPRFPCLVFASAGGAVPFQATGTYLDVAEFYFRFRGDGATLTIGRPARHVPERDYMTSKYPVFNEPYAGFLDNYQFVELFSELMNAMFIENGLPQPKEDLQIQ